MATNMNPAAVSQNGNPRPSKPAAKPTHSTSASQVRKAGGAGAESPARSAAAPRRHSAAPNTSISAPSRPGTNPGADQGLMFRAPSRSMRQDATAIAAPSTIQPAPTTRSGPAFTPRSRLGNAELLGRDLGHAGVVDDPGVGDHGRPDGVVGGLARERREQHRARLRVGLQLLRIRDARIPGPLDRGGDL